MIDCLLEQNCQFYIIFSYLDYIIMEVDIIIVKYFSFDVILGFIIIYNHVNCDECLHLFSCLYKPTQTIFVVTYSFI